MANDIKATYTGDGTLVRIGVPMRDLTAAEWNAIDAGTQKALVKEGLFKVAATKKAAAKDKDGDA